MITFIILAGGNGTRMNSDLPKVLIEVKGKAMIERILENCEALADRIIIVVNPLNKDIIESHLEQKDYIGLEFIVQDQPQGTGHAVQVCMPLLSDKDEKIMILNGDMPLIKTETLYDLINYPIPCIGTTNLSNPDGYGRIVTVNNKMIAIVEHKDCNDAERAILEVNVGIYYISYELLNKYIFNLKNKNAQKEYYLTDLFRLCILDQININRFMISNSKQYQIMGVNTEKQLKDLETIMTILGIY